MGTELDNLHRLSEAQGGLATAKQLALLGFTPKQIDGLRDRRHLLSVAPGVFRSAGVPASWLNQVVAGALFLDGRAMTSGATAARLFAFQGFERSGAVEFSCERASRGIGGQITVHSARQLDAIDRTTCQIPDWGNEPVPPELEGLGIVRTLGITTPCRTIIDLAHRMPVPALARLVDSAISMRLTSFELLIERLESLRDSGVRGVRRMDQVLVDAGVESWLERKFLELLREAGLPRPQCQVIFRDGSRTVARVDFLFSGTNVVVEVSGRRGHVTDAERQKDARRRNELQRAGMQVIEFVTIDVVRDPAYVVRTIRAALAGGTLRS